MSAPFGPGCPWYDDLQRFGPANVKWCEQTVCSYVNEPANAWSNLAYILPALWFIHLSRQDGNKEGERVAWAALVMGALSFAYHSTNNLLTQYFDFLGMFLWAVYLVVLRLRRAYGVARSPWTYWAGVAVFMGLTPAMHALHLPFQALVALLAFAILGLEFACRARGVAGDGRLIAWAVVFFFAGALCSLADVTRTFCIPTHPFLQGHALWHCLAGVGAALMTIYHRRLAVLE